MPKRKIPHSAREAYAMLDKMISNEEKAMILSNDKSLDLHFGLGAWIRNNWIYPKNGILSEQGGWIKKDIIIIPDMISAQIIDGYIRHLKRLQNKH